MLRIKKCITTVLAIMLIINILQINISAEGEEDFSSEKNTVEITESPSVDQLTNENTVVVEEPQENKTLSQESVGVEDNQITEQEVITVPEELIQAYTEEDSGNIEYQNSGDFYDDFSSVLTNADITGALSKDNVSGQVTLTIGSEQSKILELLSQMQQTTNYNYQDWNIRFNFSGILTLGEGFKGLGDEGFPFKGKFTDQAIIINASNTIFKELHASADLYGVQIYWQGEADKPILAKKLIADESDHEINMPLSKASSFSPYIECLVTNLSGTTGEITLPVLDYSSVENKPTVDYQNDVGLACGRMESGTKLKVTEIKFYSENDAKYTGIINLSSKVANNDTNTGSLVGNMGEGAILTISQDISVNAVLNGTNVGGLVGSMTNAKINFSEGKKATVNATLTGLQSAGGIAGVMTTKTGPLGTNANVVLASITANGTENSGVLYGTCTATDEFNSLNGISFGGTRVVFGPGNCGGLFGTLNLSGNGICNIAGAGDMPVTITSKLTSAANTTFFGGVVGMLTGDAKKNVLKLYNCKIETSIDVGTESVKYPKYLGGIIAKQCSTLDVKNTTVNVKSPKTVNGNDYGFGGVTAYLDDDALLIAEDMAIITDSYVTNPGGGGVVGSTHKGSIVYLKNNLNLKECQLYTNGTTGQIVGYQDCSLIYAPVNITRLDTMVNGKSTQGMELDDIGNYGEMYRVDGFLEIDTDYNTSFPRVLKKTDEQYVLKDKYDYACLALAWQSRGNFLTVSGIDNSNWDTLKQATISLENDINLQGCGIGGLTRDVNFVDDTFTGIFNGNDKTITLDIGATNVANGVSIGDGRIYRHNATGLFAGLSNNATVQNLTLGGSVRISNNKISTMSSGALAAQVNDSRTSGSLLSKVSTAVKYDAKVNGGNALYLGGLIGQITSGSAKIAFDSGSSLGATINISQSGNGSYNHFGGAVGAVANTANINITCVDATINGVITSTGSVANFYAGGLIGTILPSSSNIARNINIINLTVNDFELTSNASERMGGILGGIWADTSVALDGLKVNNTTLTANNIAELGGLIYRASGKWMVSSVNLGGLKINTKSDTKALGLLVCHGDPYKDLFNGGNQNMNGLYFEMTEHWDWEETTEKGYNVPSVITFGSGVFDEFVAYTAYADKSSNTPNYQITSNGSGIISLKTDNDVVNMTTGDRNTYVNRTNVGLGKQINNYSRYYYNLSKVIEDCNNDTLKGGDGIDTANELLIWSVYRYAANNLKSYFVIDNVTENDIGGSASSSPASFDMSGLSYYPININDSDITVKYAEVKFYNQDIEEKESGNKSTRGNSESNSQHYTMHCSLFLDYVATSVPVNEKKEYKLLVNGVSFAGTVGVVNTGSGALISGNVEGLNDGTNTVVCKVVLSDEDHEGKAIMLNGISVVPSGDYNPVLINKIGSYSTLEASCIINTQQQIDRAFPAGSSLIGDVGSDNATNITVAFGGTIRLSETPNKVFAKATLLNSLQYADGSATYTFESSKDAGTIRNTTHGYELSESVEYAGKCGFYDDDIDNTNKIPSPEGEHDFTSYLPYVANSPAKDQDNYPLNEKWHELAVNIHSEPLIDGCGTYGHPYKVTAKELREVANYINNGVAFTGWQVRVPNGDTYHTEKTNNTDILLTYKNGGWKKEDDTAYSGNVREHLQSAYYQLTYTKDESGNSKESSIILSNFPGIGTNPDWAFKGVITGKIDEASVVTVKLTGGSSAFIKYSYGSVVRDVDIVLENAPLLNRIEPARPIGVTEAKKSPDTFFGGIIGSVLGGDNIIENVTVTIVPTSDTRPGFTVNPTGSKTHLVPIGGFVGVINGGGVIFRGSCTSGYSGDTNNYYNNPFIGRVLGGYAFYEGEGNDPDIPDNGKIKDGEKCYQDYKINAISSSTSDLNWDDSNKTINVNTAQGLLILSAIVSSGAGSTASVSYLNGVARNAKYDKIGQRKELASSDFNLAQSDISGTASYLLKHFSNCTERVDFCTSDTNGISIKFAANATFDMDHYENGYRGLSARYVSNATYKSNGVDASTVVMRVKTFDGQDATVQNINMKVNEYADDDFHMASMGGIFNIVWTKKRSGGSRDGSNFAQNLILQNCNVQMHYIGANGNPENQADTSSFIDQDGLSCVTVGGFIGSASDVEGDNGKDSVFSNYLFTRLSINSGKIIGPNSAGGLIGATAMTNATLTGCPGKLLSNSLYAHMGPSFLNCSYSNVAVKSALASGGLVGDTYAQNNSTIPTFIGLGISKTNDNAGHYASVTVTDSNLIVGANSTIIASAKGGVSGGLFGATGMQNLVNDIRTDNKTKLQILNANAISKIIINSVSVSACTENVTLKTTSAGNNGYENANWATAGGLIGRLGSVNYSYFYDTQIIDCHITTGGNTTHEYSGGIVGVGYTNTKLTIRECEIIGTEQQENSSLISGKNAGGFLGYGYQAPGFNFNLSDCSINNTTVNGTNSSGGIVGCGASKYYLYNILIKNSSIIGGTASRLIGNTKVNNHDFDLYASGISVYIDPNKERIIPHRDVDTTDYNGYIAYADYIGTNLEVENQETPYVTVNPNYSLIGTEKTIYGDAVGKIQGDTYNSAAARIWADSKTDAAEKKNLAPYVNATSIVNASGKTVPEVSTFKLIQGYSDEEWSLTDLPVLVLKGNDANAIEDYLNVITNGGYGIAKSNGKITVDESSVSVYYYNKKTKEFSLATNNQLATNPASIYYENSQFHVRSRSFDNTLDRFSLVEVNFNVTINGEQRTYTVSLPVVVIRELQYDYMATFSYGKEFMSSKYNGIKTHLLESTGNPLTVYLTYQYNRENEEYREYDWQTYMDDGGNMLTIDKVLNFSSGLPTGTQMILVDCQNGNQAYQFTTTSNKTNDVKMSDFISLIDGTKFQSSMADVLGVTRSEPTDSGKFVKIGETDKENETVCLDGTYYRLYKEENDVGKARYDLTVPDLSASVPTENYYLVITVPDQDNSDYYINGSLTSYLSWTMPSSGTKLHRYLTENKDDKVDDSNNTESTYQISTGYRQELVSTADSGKVDLSVSTNEMQVKLQDTITFSNQQVYGDSDQLFLKFTANLKEHKNENGNETSEERQFPVGTSGTVKFYVQDPTTNTYYTWNDTGWTSQQLTEGQDLPVAASYPWESNGGNMELLLSTDGKNALNLATVRQTIKGAKTEGDSRIVVTAEMDVEFGTPVVLEAAIPGSDKAGADIWAQMHYISQISTQEGSIDYSSMRNIANDNAGYYRNVTYQAVLSMDAVNIDQLGVNPLQLIEDYQETFEGRNASRIDLNAVLDLSNLQVVESLLEKTNGITFTLSLKRRNGDVYEDMITTSEEPVYTVFEWDNDSDITDWSWTISKEEYYANNSVNTSGIFDGTQFSFPITAYVFTDKKNYANYSINLSVSFDGVQQQPSLNDSDAYVVYTYACIKPTFYEFNSGN